MALNCAGVLVAGGYGTRLAPITNVLPKVLVPVGKQAMLDIMVDQMTSLGITSIHLLLGHQAELVRAYVEGRPQLRERANIHLHTDTGDLGTAGPLRILGAEADALFVMNGDVLTTADLGQLLRSHLSAASDLTIATTDYSVRVPYGVLHSDDRSQLMSVEEKPSIEFQVSAGIYVVGPAALAEVPSDGPDDMPDLITRCVKAGLSVRTHALAGGAWFDLGTEEGYRRSLEYSASDRADDAASRTPGS
ncbi:sugar phosphate nucleotidyltransferase [Streptomyces globisporus]|uniref:sugar phosphate nucleotidyltransferase n=1 Tax=Streptomyces globisporus TaxID=1908 RepID=UPI003799E034